MSHMDYYSPDYATARDRFLAAARDCGATIRSHRFQADGPNGGPLTMDVARLGPPEPERAVIVSSGLHGVEGFFGSAVQLAWLLRVPGRSPPPRTGLVMVHALNPFGFAWQRRWNESNVDLNRNFLDDREFLQADPNYRESRAAYDRLSAFLNPASSPSRWEPYSIKAVLRVMSAGYDARRRCLGAGEPAPPRFAFKALRDLGLLELQKTLPVGQYEHPTGLFYGGAGPEETVRVVRDSLPEWVAGAGEVMHIDLHSGLGKYADYRLLIVDEKGSERERWASEHFGEGVVEALDGRTAYAARGLMAKDLRDRLAGIRYQCLTAEFGTYPGVRVVGALRAENRAHFFDRPGTASYRWTKRQVMEVFCPSASLWREAVVRSGLKIIDQAIASGRGERVGSTAGTA